MYRAKSPVLEPAPCQHDCRLASRDLADLQADSSWQYNRYRQYQRETLLKMAAASATADSTKSPGRHCRHKHRVSPTALQKQHPTSNSAIAKNVQSTTNVLLRWWRATRFNRSWMKAWLEESTSTLLASWAACFALNKMHQLFARPQVERHCLERHPCMPNHANLSPHVHGR